MTGDTNTPRVSCIIAVYNGDSYLHEAIESVLSQTYSNMELIVVNDGSTDRTAEVIGRYGGRIRALHQENRGVSVARNRGVEMSTGELLCFLDADDVFDVRKTEVQVDVLQADPQLDLCDCHSLNFWSPDIPPEVLCRDSRYVQPFWREPAPGHIISWLFRRRLWDRVGGFALDLRYAEDVDWFSRARDLSMRRATVPDVLVHRRLHPGNVTARRESKDAGTLADVLKAHLTRVRNRSPH
jgi:glycosyltransferase involved in cell wall biosynthesis